MKDILIGVLIAFAGVQAVNYFTEEDVPETKNVQSQSGKPEQFQASASTEASADKAKEEKRSPSRPDTAETETETETEKPAEQRAQESVFLAQARANCQQDAQCVDTAVKASWETTKKIYKVIREE